MIQRRLHLELIPGRFAICRLAPDQGLPDWAAGGALLSLTWTHEELSVVCDQDAPPEGVVCERDWQGMRVVGHLVFEETGILASIAQPLAEAGIPLFAQSTYLTDYILVKGQDLAKAVTILRGAGHQVDLLD